MVKSKPKTKAKKLKPWHYILIVLAMSIFEVILILPEVFETTFPVDQPDFLFRAAVFVAWKAIEAAVGYYITRG